jgi:hypothetical protein
LRIGDTSSDFEMQSADITWSSLCNAPLNIYVGNPPVPRTWKITMQFLVETAVRFSPRLAFSHETGTDFWIFVLRIGDTSSDFKMQSADVTSHHSSTALDGRVFWKLRYKKENVRRNLQQPPVIEWKP